MNGAIDLTAGGASAELPLADAFASRARLLRDFIFYGLSSAVALAVDWGLLTVLVSRNVPVVAASATSFSTGMIITYLASVGFIFSDRRRGSKLRELTLFVLIGVAGLGLNVLLICGFGALFGLPAPIAKAPTVAIVFLFNFTMRRAMLFAAPAS